MKSSLSSSLLLAYIAFFQNHQLDAQVVFARPKGSIVKPGNDTIGSCAGLRVSYFDSKTVAKGIDPGNGKVLTK